MDEMTFTYYYSADERKEAEAIREKYLPKSDQTADTALPPLDELKKLDRETTRPGLIVSLMLGIVGTLTLGGGMSMVMVGSAAQFFPGIGVGVVGLVLAALALPVYNWITAKKRQQNAARIMELTEKIS